MLNFILQRKNTDWMGLWFKILKERGENDLVSFEAHQLLEQTKIDLTFSHQHYDGWGRMYSFLKITIPHQKLLQQFITYSKTNSTPKPLLSKRIKSLFHLVLASKNYNPNWKHFHQNSYNKYDPLFYHYNIFTREETERLLSYCLSNKLNVNHYILSIANKYLNDYYSLSRSSKWVYPVNMRPHILKNLEEANHSSSIILDLDLADSPQNIKTKVKKQFERNQQWAIWYFHHIGILFGEKVMRKISDSSSKKNYFTGTFSVLPLLDNDHLIFTGAPPGSKNFPIGILLARNSAQLAISLKIHPSIMAQPILYKQEIRDQVQMLKDVILLTIAKQ